YSVTVQLCMSFMGFSANISNVFLPKLSALAAQEDMQETNAIFLKVGRLQFYIVMLIFWGFVLFGRRFLHLWVGDSFMPAYTYAVILMAALIIPLVQNTGILILQAKNKHAFRAIVFVIIAILNVCISIPLAKEYGALACAWVTAGCLLLGQGLILNVYYAKLGIKVISFFGHILKIFAAMSLPVGISVWVLSKYSLQPSIFMLASQIFIFTILYGLTMWLLAMNTYEKNLILTPLKNLWRIYEHKC
ncbi:MAG: polysaccharide biosynthesis C-terminal domain-containing protein, partial [Elusimicrobiaceae bacterium]|nr:polysaccharide biosynthesis C-terminal domain-containing protein [Elusimicrobiaceae bacterium]